MITVSTLKKSQEKTNNSKEGAFRPKFFSIGELNSKSITTMKYKGRLINLIRIVELSPINNSSLNLMLMWQVNC